MAERPVTRHRHPSAPVVVVVAPGCDHGLHLAAGPADAAAGGFRSGRLAAVCKPPGKPEHQEAGGGKPQTRTAGRLIGLLNRSGQVPVNCEVERTCDDAPRG